MLLKQIGEHPFITVHQLKRVLGVSQSWVYDRLRELKKEGLVGDVNPRHPDVQERAFYYLTPAGEERLSLPRRRGRPRFLERIAMVYEVRNLFISAQCAGLPIFQWQVLTPGVYGVSLHGAALTANDRQLMIEWDRGERPLRLYKHRLRRVAAAAAKTGAGLLLVAANETRGVTLLSILANYFGLKGPHLAMTSRAVLAAQGISDAVCYVPALMDFVSLGGFAETLPAPWGENLPLSPGVMSFPGQWEGNSQLVVELSPLQKMLLSILAGLPLITAGGLTTLSGGRSEEWVRRHVGDLESRGLVEEYVADPNLLQRHYFPTYAGLAFLAAACGTSTKAYARARGWTVKDGAVSISHLARNFQHTQEAREIVLVLARESLRHHQTITWYDERESYVYFTMGGRLRVLAPDARIHWGRQVFFVEVDRGTSSVNRLRSKIQRYYDFRICAEHRRFGEQFCLLVVVPLPYRERQWLELVSQYAAEENVSPLDILTTTREAIQKRGISAPIWRGVQDVTRRIRLTGEQC